MARGGSNLITWEVKLKGRFLLLLYELAGIPALHLQGRRTHPSQPSDGQCAAEVLEMHYKKNCHFEINFIDHITSYSVIILRRFHHTVL